MSRRSMTRVVLAEVSGKDTLPALACTCRRFTDKKRPFASKCATATVTGAGFVSVTRYWLPLGAPETV